MSTGRYDVSWSASQMRGAGTRTDGGIGVPTMNEHNNLLSFLAVVEYYDFDYIDVKWKQGLDVLGAGGTATVRELYITENYMLAYKRHKALEALQYDKFGEKKKNLSDSASPDLAEKVFNEMVAEVTVLGHPLIRNHQNIVGLAGIYWEIAENSVPWPILVFDKAHRGDLWSFAKSSEGLQMNFKDRLGICLDIAQAISALHALDMIHGDIKPQNFLIYIDNESKHPDNIVPEITHAKLADFGYAGWNMNPSEEVSLRLPESWPWTAPEYHHRAFSIQQAKQLEIFSFGLSCLWFLFHDRLSFLDPVSQANLMEDFCEDAFYNPEFIATLKRNKKSSQLACELVGNENSLSEAARQLLITFFRSTLSIDTNNRTLPVQCLANAAGYEACYEIRVLDIEQHNVDHTSLSLTIAGNFNALVDGPYRIREYLASCFEQEALHGRNLESKTKAAFQYSFCCKIGFGRPSSEDESKRWLEISERSPQDLQRDIEIIKRRAIHAHRRFRNFGYGVSLAGTPGDKDSVQTTSEARVVLKREIEDFSRILPAQCSLLSRMKWTLVDNLFEAGEVSEAEKYLSNHIKHAATHAPSDGDGGYKTGSETFRARRERIKAETAARVKAGRYVLDVLENDREKIKKVVGVLDILQPDASSCSPGFTEIIQSIEFLTIEDMSAANLLARVFIAQKRWKEAEILLVQTRNLLSIVASEWDGLMAMITENLAKLYEKTDRWAEAESIYSFLVRLFNARNGPGHPETLAMKIKLLNLQTIRNFQLDESLLMEMHNNSSRVYGQAAKYSTSMLTHLYQLYMRLFRYKEAEEVLRQLLSLSNASSLDEHTLYWTNNELAYLLLGQNRQNEAEVFLRANLQIEKTVENLSYYQKFAAKVYEATTLRNRGNLMDSASLFEQLLREQTVELPNEDDKVRIIKERLALTYHGQKRYLEEEQLFVSEIAKMESLENPPAGDLGAWKSSLAEVYIRQKRLGDAERVQVEAIATMSKRLTHDDVRLLEGQWQLAKIYFLQRRFQDVVRVSTSKIETLKHRFGPTHNVTLSAMQRLASSLTATKRWKEAETTQLAYLDIIMRPECDHLSQRRLGAIAFRAELLLATGRWGKATVFICRHCKSLILWYWSNLYWTEVRPVLRFLFNPYNFPNNAYVLGFLVTMLYVLILGFYYVWLFFVWSVRSTMLANLS